jgi:hypothetical protein
MLRPTRILAQFVAPWTAFSAVFAFLAGAAVFSEPSDCFRYGQQNRSQQGTQSEKSKPNTPSGSHNTEATTETPSAHEKCHPYWGPEWSLVWVSIGLLIGTGSLAFYTAYLYRSTRDIARDSRKSSAQALQATKEHTETLAKIERAYLVAGGGTAIVNSVRCFGLDVANYGRTPAFLRAYDVQFGRFDDVKSYPCTVNPRHPWDDQLAPGQWKGGIAYIPIPPGAQVVYGAFWYVDRANEKHFHRFILRIGPLTTHPDVAGVDDMYRYQD